MNYEDLLEAFYRKLNLSGATVMDIGAHLGRHSFPLSSLVGDNGAVLAFEPLPEMRSRFVDLMRDRKITNIVLFPFALSSISGTAEFSYVPEFPEESGLKERYRYNTKPKEIIKTQVNIRTLDEFIMPSLPLEFIKIDVEGAELAVLEGGREVLKMFRPIVAFECGAGSYLSYHSTPELLFKVFDELNYVVFSITGISIKNPEEFALHSRQELFWDYIAIPCENENAKDALQKVVLSG